jgi:hypothetical protein
MSYGTYRNTDHPNPMPEPRSPRREYQQRMKREREAREMARLSEVLRKWDRDLDNQQQLGSNR